MNCVFDQIQLKYGDTQPHLLAQDDRTLCQVEFKGKKWTPLPGIPATHDGVTAFAVDGCASCAVQAHKMLPFIRKLEKVYEQERSS